MSFLDKRGNNALNVNGTCYLSLFATMTPN